MYKESFFMGYPAEFKHICLVYPPKVKDIRNNKQFGIYMKLLTLSQEELEDELIQAGGSLEGVLTPLEYLLNLGYNSAEFYDLIKKAFYFFIHEEIRLLPEQKKIVIGEITKDTTIDTLRVLNEEEYFHFQNCIREACGLKMVEPADPDEDPRVKAIKAKARYRDKIKAKTNAGLNLFSLLVSICCMGIGINPLNIGELSYASLSPLVASYQSKEKFETDIDTVLAGADPKKVKPKYWIHNLEDE